MNLCRDNKLKEYFSIKILNCGQFKLIAQVVNVYPSRINNTNPLSVFFEQFRLNLTRGELKGAFYD